jgi:hypothetical protein
MQHQRPERIRGLERPEERALPRRRRHVRRALHDRHHGEPQPGGDEQRPVGDPGQRDQDEPGDAVQAQDVAGEQQHGVREAEHDQPAAPPPQQAPDRRFGHAGRRLTLPDLHDSVREQGGEQRVRPPVDERHDDRAGDPVRQAVLDDVLADAVRAAIEVDHGVGHRDQGQHQAPGEIRREGPVPCADRSGRCACLVG